MQDHENCVQTTKFKRNLTKELNWLNFFLCRCSCEDNNIRRFRDLIWHCFCVLCNIAVFVSSILFVLTKNSFNFEELFFVSVPPIVICTVFCKQIACYFSSKHTANLLKTLDLHFGKKNRRNEFFENDRTSDLNTLPAVLPEKMISYFLGVMYASNIVAKGLAKYTGHGKEDIQDYVYGFPGLERVNSFGVYICILFIQVVTMYPCMLLYFRLFYLFVAIFVEFRNESRAIIEAIKAFGNSAAETFNNVLMEEVAVERVQDEETRLTLRRFALKRKNKCCTDFEKDIIRCVQRYRRLVS